MDLEQQLESFVRAAERSANYVEHHGLGSSKVARHFGQAEGYSNSLGMVRLDPLYAAAPDLLAACRALIDVGSPLDSNHRKELDMAYRAAEKAIEKAGAEVLRPNLIECDYQQFAESTFEDLMPKDPVIKPGDPEKGRKELRQMTSQQLSDFTSRFLATCQHNIKTGEAV